MSSDYATGYLAAKAEQWGQEKYERFIAHLQPAGAVDPNAAAAWQQQCAALQGKVAILRAEVDKLVAENARLRGVIDLGEVAINDAVALTNKLQAELAISQSKAAKFERMYESTYRLLNEARAVIDPI